MKNHRLLPALVASLLSLAPLRAAPPVYTITDLGVLRGQTSSEGLAVNASGVVAGVSGNASFTTGTASLFFSGTTQGLGTLGGKLSTALAINTSGVAAGWSNTTGTNALGQPLQHAFITSGASLLDLTGSASATAGFTSLSQAAGINDSGVVVGFGLVGTGSNNSPITRAFRYTSGTVLNLGTLVTGGTTGNSAAAAINASGSIVGQSDYGTSGVTGQHAFLFSSGTMHDLGSLSSGTLNSCARAINASGQVAGWSQVNGDSFVHAALFVSGTVQDLGKLSGTSGVDTFATGISASGDIVGYSGTGASSAFLRTSGSMYDLNAIVPAANMGGFTKLLQASGINDNGQIVGFGQTSTGVHAFLATQGPSLFLIAWNGQTLAQNTALSFAGPPAVDAAGNVAFHMIVTGSNKNKTNNSGIVIFSGTTHSFVATTGTAAPDTGGAIWTKLSDPVLSGSGALAFIGTLQIGTGTNSVTTAANSTGVWLYQSGSTSLLVRADDQAPDWQGNFNSPASYSSFSQIVVNNAGGIGFLAGLKGPVNTTGLFATDASGNLQMLVAKGQTAPSFSSFVPLPLVGGQSRTIDTVIGNAAIVGKLDPNLPAEQIIGLELSGSDGFSPIGLAETSGTVPNMPGVIYKSLHEPIVNANGSVAFYAALAGSGINATNNAGIGIVTTGTQSVIVRTGNFAPGVGGAATPAVFTKLSDPVLNNTDAVAFVGTLKTGGGSGVVSSDDTGIWVYQSNGTGKQIVREGDAAPGGGKFSAFTQLVLPDVGGPIFLANVSGVPAAKNQGVFAMTKKGEVVSVVLKGGSLPFVNSVLKTVKTIGIFQQAAQVLGQSRSFEASTAKLVFQATFTDGNWGIYEAAFP